jgi:hypothetical protein
VRLFGTRIAQEEIKAISGLRNPIQCYMLILGSCDKLPADKFRKCNPVTAQDAGYADHGLGEPNGRN